MKGAMSSVFFQQGFCTEARCYPKRRSPNLEWRCSICSTVPRLTACPLLMVVTLLWLLPWSALGIQSQYPSRTPCYIVPRGACLTWPADYAYGYNGSYRRGLSQPIDGPSACVLKVWWAVARIHRISLQTVNSPYLCPTRWWRTACMVGQE